MDIISVILPVYNQEKYIVDAVDSILNQKFETFELLIHDDGSTDNTLDILQKYYGNNDKIHLSFSQNQGKCKATNMLVEKSKHDWLVLMDADDIMLPGRLEKQVLFHINNPEIAASSSNCLYIDENGKYIGKQISMELDTKEKFEQKVENGENIFCAFTALMIKKSIWLDLGGLRSQFRHAHDLDFYTRMVENKHVFLIVDDFFMKYRIHQKSATRSKYFLTSFYGDYAFACKKSREAGLDEISFNEYQAEFKSKNLLYKAMWYRKKLARLLHKNAGFYFYKKNIAFSIISLLFSIILDYTLIIPTLKKQLKHISN